MGIFGRKDEDEAKPKADFSNVRSGGSSSAPTPMQREAQRDTAAAGRSYTVVSGDSLSRIAQDVYGDASQWRKIYEANRDTIKDPDVIHPGDVPHLPEA